MAGHRWSGWPGAWCLDCGAEDPSEIALADDDYEEILDEGGNVQDFRFRYDPKLDECPEPASSRCNPYAQ